MKPYLSLFACIVMLLCIMPVHGESIVADYVISPSVLQPGDVGRSPQRYQNTRVAGERPGKYGSADREYFQVQSYDIGVNIESVTRIRRIWKYMSGNYKRIGAIGQSIPMAS